MSQASSVAVSSGTGAFASKVTQPNARRVTRVVFIALLLDILAFTIILPLLPRLIDYYREQEGDREVSARRQQTGRGGSSLDTVLLGGALGSLFSLLQFIASPVIGHISDRIGRRTTLLGTMLGNIAACLLWVFSGNFAIFLLARIVGGLFEGNVQLSVAIITDVTDRTTRSRGLALVGIAFAIGFTVGPAMGAYFAGWNLHETFPAMANWGPNPYSGAAVLALALVTIETLFVWRKLEETAQYRGVVESAASQTTDKKTPTSAEALSFQQRLQNLRQLDRLHFLHLLLFSGMEYTLTFLTHDVHGFSPMQNGKLLGVVGIVSTLVQGGYVRRFAYRYGEKRLVLQGVIACALALLAIAQSAYAEQHIGSGHGLSWLWVSAFLLAFTSATVVNCLTALASMQCDDEADAASAESVATGKPTSDRVSVTRIATMPQLARGAALGRFRSVGQLGRAAGPLLACTVYWLAGPVVCYVGGAVGVLCIAALVRITAPDRPCAAREKTA
ncbi:major facilitator superfamily domain-containing protein [Thamnocephalis sphaerospora]|uniref:Major facilitator superfamily domain-containing protein n=1 Tax=Thamnocephalis sphaerospora TaxID=78915 RepID=A0A4P9XVU8_9FUNG|nr:major facilitator superfamily domain-containing protein [Thamnocephalis sphaerospora]|eukprot:RKP10416.1 major facilitator superfamily domain-containing protein [Thamnocephalis sphaerospora]